MPISLALEKVAYGESISLATVLTLLLSAFFLTFCYFETNSRVSLMRLLLTRLSRGVSVKNEGVWLTSSRKIL